MNGIGEDRVRDHLEKVLSSPEFENSERLRRFLRFTVEALLGGEQDQVKEYLIGKEVFDRNADYDPRLDPIVRVEARRLRKKLDEYYAGPGASDAVRIHLPKGSYVPEILPVSFAAAEPDPPPSGGGKRVRWSWIVAGLAIVAVAAVLIFLSRSRSVNPEGAIAVMPARWVWPGEDFPAIRHDEDVAERIGADLAGRQRKPVIAWPSLQRFRDRKVSTREIAKELNADRILIVAVRVEADGFRVTAYMIDPILDRKLNVSDKRHVSLQTAADRDRVASELAAAFAGPA